MRIVEVLLNVIGWLQIVAATTIMAALIAIAYVYFTATHSLMLVYVIAGLGLIIGVVWATRIWIKHGTVQWLSRIREVN